MDCSLPGSSVHGIFQARILEWVAISFSRRPSWSRDWTQVFHIVGRHFTVWATRKVHYPAAAAAAKSLQSCPTLCDPVDCSPLGFSVHGILQARILEWVAISFSRGSFLPSRRCGFNSWVLKIPWRRKLQPTPVFLPVKFHGQRSLVGYCPRGCKRVRHNLMTKTTT